MVKKKKTPLDIRLSFLLGLRWQLIQWGYAKHEVKVDDESLTMSVDKVPVVSAAVANDKISVKWLEHEWGSWDQLQRAGELQALIDVGNAKLSKAAEGRSKGKSKGKPYHH